jgi:hypothetical protein
VGAVLLQWRRPAEGELDHERLWLAVGAGAAATAAAGARLGMRLPPCFFHLATGFPCPGCGGTRALRQLSHGHLLAALAFNPLVTLGALAGVAWVVYAAAVLLLRMPRLRVGEVSAGCALGVRLGVCAVVLANWWWVIAHHM